jgi:hypothetical protein
MSFFDEAARAKTYLREHGRVSMRALRRGFALDDAALDELVEELVEVQQVAVREGPVLVSTAAARSEGATVDRPIDASTPVVTPSPESADAFVLTAYLTDTIKKGHQLWPPRT